MASRLVRGTAIGCGVAALVGGGVGFAVGEPVSQGDIPPPRALPSDLCTKIGDVSSLLPKASAEAVTMIQGGTSVITCQAGSSRAKVRAYSSASVRVTITPYGGQDAGAGNTPFTPDQVARRTFTRSPLKSYAKDRPYPTKVSRTESGLAGESWNVHALVQHADVVVLVEYTANPIDGDSAQQAALALADRAVWESR